MRSIAARQRVCSGSGLQLRAADAPAPAPAPALAPGPTLQAAAPAPGLRLQLRLQLWPVEPRADSREVHFQPRSLLTQLSLSLSLHLRLSARPLLAGGRLPAPAGSSTELRPSHAPEGLRAGVIRHRHRSSASAMPVGRLGARSISISCQHAIGNSAIRRTAAALALTVCLGAPAGSVGLRTWVALRRALRCGELCPK